MKITSAELSSIMIHRVFPSSHNFLFSLELEIFLSIFFLICLVFYVFITEVYQNSISIVWNSSQYFQHLRHSSSFIFLEALWRLLLCGQLALRARCTAMILGVTWPTSVRVSPPLMWIGKPSVRLVIQVLLLGSPKHSDSSSFRGDLFFTLGIHRILSVSSIFWNFVVMSLGRQV